jgi:hypothetical protein
MTLSMQDADVVASNAEALIRDGSIEQACLLLDPLAFRLAKFTILDRAGMRLGHASLENTTFLEVLDRMISLRKHEADVSEITL